MKGKTYLCVDLKHEAVEHGLYKDAKYTQSIYIFFKFKFFIFLSTAIKWKLTLHTPNK